MSLIRTHVALPADLLRKIDAEFGKRRRSAFLSKAAANELRRHLQIKALENLKKHPFKGGPAEWETDSAGWVHRMRRESTAIRERRLRRKQQ